MGAEDGTCNRTTEQPQSLGYRREEVAWRTNADQEPRDGDDATCANPDRTGQVPVPVGAYLIVIS